VALPAQRVARLWKLEVFKLDDQVRARGADDEQDNAGGATDRTN
jgi:hypothetical protein